MEITAAKNRRAVQWFLASVGGRSSAGLHNQPVFGTEESSLRRAPSERRTQLSRSRRAQNNWDLLSPPGPLMTKASSSSLSDFCLLTAHERELCRRWNFGSSSSFLGDAYVRISIFYGQRMVRATNRRDWDSPIFLLKIFFFRRSLHSRVERLAPGIGLLVQSLFQKIMF